MFRRMVAVFLFTAPAYASSVSLIPISEITKYMDFKDWFPAFFVVEDEAIRASLVRFAAKYGFTKMQGALDYLGRYCEPELADVISSDGCVL
jgi:hypothetical protein